MEKIGEALKLKLRMRMRTIEEERLLEIMSEDVKFEIEEFLSEGYGEMKEMRVVGSISIKPQASIRKSISL